METLFEQTEHYFSESSGQLVQIAEMVPPYARNAMKKLMEYEDFPGSPLHLAFLWHLRPTSARALQLLVEYGTCSYYCGSSAYDLKYGPVEKREKYARSMFYRIGKKLRVPVHTTKKGDFIEGSRIPKEQVRIPVRGH